MSIREDQSMVLNHNLVLIILLIFFLLLVLIPELKAGKPSRVVVVSSLANKRGDINWDDINWEEDTMINCSLMLRVKLLIYLFAKQLNKLYAFARYSSIFFTTRWNSYKLTTATTYTRKTTACNGMGIRKMVHLLMYFKTVEARCINQCVCCSGT